MIRIRYVWIFCRFYVVWAVDLFVHIFAPYKSIVQYLTINKSKHNNENGLYHTHIYAFNSKGEIIGTATTSVSLK